LLGEVQKIDDTGHVNTITDGGAHDQSLVHTVTLLHNSEETS
jgi:hypothetical protein